MWMEHSRTWFNGGLGIVRLMTGLSSLKGLLQLKKKNQLFFKGEWIFPLFERKHKMEKICLFHCHFRLNV